MLKDKLKHLALSAFIGAILSLAFLMPVTLQVGLVDRVEPIARLFCPETGQLAPRYWHGRSTKSNPDRWEACINAEGSRVNSEETHRSIIFTVAGSWFVIIAPIFYALLTPMFPVRRSAKRR